MKGELLFQCGCFFDHAILCNILFSQINSAEGVLPNDEFLKIFILPFSKNPLKANLRVKPL